MWCADGHIALLHVRSQRRREHLGVAATPGSAPRQITRFTDGRAAVAVASARRRRRSSSSATSGSGRSTRRPARPRRCRSRCAARRPGRQRRAPAADQPVPGPGALARRQEGRVRRARRDVRRVRQGRRRRGAGDDDAGGRVAARLVARQPAAGVRRPSATAPHTCTSTTSRPSKETPLTQALRRDDAPAVLAGRQAVAFVARRHGAAGDRSRVEAGALAGERADSPIRRPRTARSPGRPTASWIAYFDGRRDRGVHERLRRPAAGGDGKPVSFLANGNADASSWSPDGTFLLFDTSQRTEIGQLVRVDLMPRTPKFREDQFRDLFKRGERRRARRRAPADADADRAGRRLAASARRNPHAGAKPRTGRHRLRRHPPARRRCCRRRRRRRRVISPDGKTLLLTRAPRGQQNLYIYPLDELSQRAGRSRGSSPRRRAASADAHSRRTARRSTTSTTGGSAP